MKIIRWIMVTITAVTVFFAGVMIYQMCSDAVVRYGQGDEFFYIDIGFISQMVNLSMIMIGLCALAWSKIR